MHVGVVSRDIVCYDMCPSCWCLVFDVIGDLHNSDVVNLFVLINNVEVELFLILNYVKC